MCKVDENSKCRKFQLLNLRQSITMISLYAFHWYKRIFLTKIELNFSMLRKLDSENIICFPTKDCQVNFEKSYSHAMKSVMLDSLLRKIVIIQWYILLKNHNFQLFDSYIYIYIYITLIFAEKLVDLMSSY